MDITNSSEVKFDRPDCELVGMKNEWLAAIRTWGATRPRIEAIYLFGSRAKHKHRPDSDIDLALLFTPNRNDTEAGYWMCENEAIQSELAVLLPVKPHVFPLNYARVEDDVTPAVFEHGIRIYYSTAGR
jgi:predicted nucleotidyltransferase